jgi:hypothetical protein
MHRSLSCTNNLGRRYLSQARTALENEKLLASLKRNPEIDAEDAKNELRWMKQSLSDRNERTLSLLVERRARGEPLQYILGEIDANTSVASTRKSKCPTRPYQTPNDVPLMGAHSPDMMDAHIDNVLHVSCEIEDCAGQYTIPEKALHKWRIHGIPRKIESGPIKRQLVGSIWSTTTLPMRNKHED